MSETKVGRPSEYDPGYCEMLIQHMADGLSFEAFGGLICVAKQTLYNWLKAHPEFVDAKNIGWSRSLYYWEKVGRDGLHNESIKEETQEDGTRVTVTRSINAAIYCFNMKNRFQWRDKQPDEEAPADDDKRDEQKLSPSDYAKLLKERKEAQEKERKDAQEKTA